LHFSLAITGYWRVSLCVHLASTVFPFASGVVVPFIVLAAFKVFVPAVKEV
jgi:hypothetical protein